MERVVSGGTLNAGVSRLRHQWGGSPRNQTRPAPAGLVVLSLLEALALEVADPIVALEEGPQAAAVREPLADADLV